MKVFVDHYFPIQLRILGLILIGFGVPLYIKFGVIAALTSVLIGLILISTQYKLALSASEKSYKEYVSLLHYFEFGEKKTFDQIEYCYLTKTNFSRGLGLGPASGTQYGSEYHGYIKISEQEKIELGTLKKKEKMLLKVQDIAAYLSVEAFDRSL